MISNPSALVALRVRGPEDRQIQTDLADWVREMGFRPHVSSDADEVVTWLQEGRDRYAVSLLDAALGEGAASAWRRAQPLTGRRLVLLTRERRRELWFEALRVGVASVVPFPLEVGVVTAAIEVATRDSSREP